jgi:hypothetical protein
MNDPIALAVVLLVGLTSSVNAQSDAGSSASVRFRNR